MDKRYQVFVSSTFTDLKDERQNVIQALMEMDCIPAGMELFPATDEEQWEFIKKIINDCDYYLLIIGGRYGSLANDGISYTEKEFDYAVSQGIKIVALIHENPENLVVSKSEIDPIKIEKLKKFKEKVKTGRMVKFWKTTSELPGVVSLSLNKTMKMYPAIGWVRANQVASNELLNEINELRKENKKLKEDNKNNSIINLDEIKNLGRDFEVEIAYHQEDDFGCTNELTKKITCSFLNLFSIISVCILKSLSYDEINASLANSIFRKEKFKGFKYPEVVEFDFDNMLLQLNSYNLISLNKSTNGNFDLELTEKGRQLMMDLRTVRFDS